MGRACLLWACSVAAYAQSQAPDADSIRLARIRYVVAQNQQNLPNYTCVQTVERSVRRAANKRFELVDLLRMEVALVGSKELFSWPGAGKFEEKDLSDMVGGTIGNGAFGLHVRSVFLSDAAKFTYDGERESGGRRVFAYRYMVPQLRSGFTIRVGDRKAIVGYHGDFLVDVDSLDLLHLSVAGDDLPSFLQLESSVTSMDYARVPIGSSEFLLPKSSLLTMVDLSGNENRNRTELSRCRQYSGESVILFSDPAESPDQATSSSAPPPPAAEPVTLAEGQLLDLSIRNKVVYGTSAIGDELTALVTSDLKTRGRVLVPKGSIAYGRLLGINRRRQSSQRVLNFPPYSEILEVSLEFTALEVHGQRIPLRVVLHDISTFAVRRAAITGPGTLILSGDRLSLDAGFRMTWRVQAGPSHGEKQ